MKTESSEQLGVAQRQTISEQLGTDMEMHWKWTLQGTDSTAIQAPWTFRTSTLMLHGFLCHHVVYTTYYHPVLYMCVNSILKLKNNTYVNVGHDIE